MAHGLGTVISTGLKMAHEQSITLQAARGPKRAKRFVNISGVVKGRFAPRKAEALFRQGKRKPLGGRSFGTLRAAEKAARERSRAFK